MAKKDLAYFKKRLARLAYYLKETIVLSLPCKPVDKFLSDVAASKQLKERVDYYCKLDQPFAVSKYAVSVCDFKRDKSFVYFADTKKVVRHFSKEKSFDFVFGDVTEVPNTPAFVKSRPISGDNRNSVLLKLNAIRHYQFFEDNLSFNEKIKFAVWRGVVHQAHRRELVERFHNSDFADIGHNDLKRANSVKGFKGFMPVEEQLKYRYILSVEGYDVATNLKWAMASNSLVMMRKPRYETWFMEGRLEAGVHYVELKDDFSDLEEKITYFNQPEHLEEAQSIIANAQNYVQTFFDAKQEKLLSLMVAKKYFDLQISR